MKNLLVCFSVIASLTGLLSCQQTAAPTPVPDPDPVFKVPFFNQVDTEFRGSQTEKLLDFWYKGRSKQPVEFAVINDQQAYQTFFGQNSAGNLPVIDFGRYSLLVGNRGGNGSFQDGPANIKSIGQDLQQQPNGDWHYTVTISAKSKGQEWFGFSALAPRIDKPETVKLMMQYKFE